MATAKKKTSSSKKTTTKKKTTTVQSKTTSKLASDAVVKSEQLAIEVNQSALTAVDNTNLEGISSNTGVTVADKELYAQCVAAYPNSVEDALFLFCFKRNYYYHQKIISQLIYVDKIVPERDLPGSYLNALKKIPNIEGRTFFSQLKRANFEKIYSEDLNLLTLSEDDLKNRQQIINIVGYDPFKDEATEDRPQLYRDLTGLLSDNLRRDITKQKSAIEIVKNYMTISKYQKRVTDLLQDPDNDNQDQVDKLLQMIAKVQAIINATTKENGFSSGKSLGKGGRGMLSDVMNQVDMQHYDNGLTNFYDQATSKSIQEIADISFKSQLAQIQLSGTDYADILAQQAQLVKQAQRVARDASEALRIAKGKIVKGQLLEELEKEYKRKGISEADIQEFISREYTLWDGQ